MLRPTNDPDTNMDNVSIHGARPKTKRINEISSNDPNNNSELTSPHIDVEHDIGICKKLLSQIELYDKKYDEYGGKFSPEELDYLEKILITDDNESDGEANEVIPRPENIPMNIELRCGGSVIIRDKACMTRRKPIPDTIEDYIKAFEDCYHKKNYLRAMNLCAAGLMLSAPSNNIQVKLKLCSEMRKFSDELNNYFFPKMIPEQFLKTINDVLSHTIENYAIEINSAIDSTSYYKNKRYKNQRQIDFQSIFMNWAKKSGYVEEHLDNVAPKYSQLQCFRAMRNFQDKICNIVPDDLRSGKILLKIVEEIGIEYDNDLAITALKKTEKIFKHFNDKQGLLTTYVKMGEIYKNMNRKKMVKKYARLQAKYTSKESISPEDDR